MSTSIFVTLDYLDFHTHKLCHSEKGNILEIVSLHLGQDKRKEYFTVGMHPWWTEKNPSVNQLEQLRRTLDQPMNLAMGEMGLDNLKGPKLDIQMDILRVQLNLAKELQKPVIIHCVRAFDQLLRIKKEFPEIAKWCVHGFGRHVTLAKQLIDQGFYLSLMPSPPTKYQEWFESLPLDKLFLETDSMPNTGIREIYERVSKASGLSTDKLSRQMNQNATDFFSR